MLKMFPFPGCCGGYVIHNFGYTDCTGGDADEPHLDGMEKDLQALIQQKEGRAFLTITLNTEQREVYKKILYRNGFRLKGHGYNKPHNSIIYFYIRFNQKHEVE